MHIEKRRNLGAGYYFYSYRRIFGVINISRKNNSLLSEKAGREGFQENKAYKEFRSILQNFFIQSAGDFFRDKKKGGDIKSEKWFSIKEELNKREVIRRKEARKSTEKKKEFQKNLDEFFKGFGEKEYDIEAKKIQRTIALDIKKVVKLVASPVVKATKLTEVERKAKQKLKELQQSVSIKKPSGVGLSKQINSEWEIYLNERKSIDESVFSETQEYIINSISEASKEHDIPLDYFSRLKEEIEELSLNTLKEGKALHKEIADSVRAFHIDTVETTKSVLHEIEEILEKIKLRLNGAEIKNMDEGELLLLQKELEVTIHSTFDEKKKKLEQIREQLFSLKNIWKANSYTALELKEAQEEELVELREIRDSHLELVQIGMALNTINHEFEKVTAALRHGFKRMKAWATTNPDLEVLYQSMNRSFEHLDGYLSLFTPLDRRTHLESVEITGAQIYSFITDLFKERFSSHKVKLIATKEFKNLCINGYPSSYYPVFINLVDNSDFWLRQVRDKERIITLDANGEDMFVSDNGPGVNTRDRDNIFSLNFSRKPGGRGMGLFISRETLSNIGYELTLEDVGAGAKFRIHKKRD